MEEVLSQLNSSKKVKGNFFLSWPIDIYESNAKRQRNRENIATLGEKKMGYPSKSMLRWRGTILIFKTRFEAGMRACSCI